MGHKLDEWHYFRMSLPVRGAWVEMKVRIEQVDNSMLSLPVRGAWVEISRVLILSIVSVSLPVRGAWVEIVI